MSFLFLSRVGVGGLVCTGLILSAGCASSGKRTAQKEALAEPVTVTEAVGTEARDSLGNYRFLMQQGDTKMSADQFDAWMKANGIRVAKGAPAPVAHTEASAKKN